MPTQGVHFYCSINALILAQRARHKELTETLIAKSSKVVETDQGCEFHYSHPDVSLSELSEWVSAESKCCPLFDFHIDLQKQGQVLLLRLSGEQGIKQFIRAEFGISQSKSGGHVMPATAPHDGRAGSCYESWACTRGSLENVLG